MVRPYEQRLTVLLIFLVTNGGLLLRNRVDIADYFNPNRAEVVSMKDSVSKIGLRTLILL